MKNQLKWAYPAFFIVALFVFFLWRSKGPEIPQPAGLEVARIEPTGPEAAAQPVAVTQSVAAIQPAAAAQDSPIVLTQHKVSRHSRSRKAHHKSARKHKLHKTAKPAVTAKAEKAAKSAVIAKSARNSTYKAILAKTPSEPSEKLTPESYDSRNVRELAGKVLALLNTVREEASDVDKATEQAFNLIDKFMGSLHSGSKYYSMDYEEALRLRFAVGVVQPDSDEREKNAKLARNFVASYPDDGRAHELLAVSLAHEDNVDESAVQREYQTCARLDSNDKRCAIRAKLTTSHRVASNN